MLSRAHARVHWHNNRYHHQPSLSSLLHRRCLLLRAAAAPAMHGRIAMSALPTPELPPIVAAPATSPLPGLLGTCLCMFVAAYVGGMLPGVLSHHHDREKSGGTSSRGGALLPVLGAGLLLGAALGVILPEGFEAAYGMADKHVPDWQVAAALLGGFWVMLALDWQAARTLPTGSSTGATAAGSAGDDARGADCGGGHGQHTSMLVTPSADDTLPRDAPGAGRAMSKHARSSSSSSSGWPPLSNPAMQALLGLLVHALSDGLAVGAASLAAAPGVTLSVALAMVMHKGPVAVGLGSFLRAARWQQAQVHKGVLAFAAASPASALATYALLGALPSARAEGPGLALVLLFSGGSVLYAAAMHILPAALGTTHCAGGSHHGGRPAGRSASLGDADTLVMFTVGLIVPVLLGATAHHAHGGGVH